MTLSTARRTVFYIWVGAFLIYVGLFELAPFIRGQWVISHRQAIMGLLKILTLIVPVLSSFATFWFRPHAPHATGSVSRERWMGSLAFTLLFHIPLIILLVLFIYVHDYRGTSGGVGEGESSFEDLVADALQIGVVLFGIATAPVAFLLGIDRIEVSTPLPTPEGGGQNEPA